MHLVATAPTAMGTALMLLAQWLVPTTASHLLLHLSLCESSIALAQDQFLVLSPVLTGLLGTMCQDLLSST
jgi:uncharacterized membrane protein